MKISWFKGDLSHCKSSEMDSVVHTFKDAAKSKSVIKARRNAQHCTPGSYPVGMEKVSVVNFSSLYKQGAWHSYTGLVLLEFNGLETCDQAQAFRQQVTTYIQPFMAFVGSGGKSVKVVLRYTLPDGTLPLAQESARCFHAHAYKHAARFFQAQFGRKVSLKEPSLERSCRVSYDTECYYNPESLPIKQEQPSRMPEETDAPTLAPSAGEPVDKLLPGMPPYEKHKMLFEMCLADALKMHGDKNKDPEQLVVAVAERCFDTGVEEEDVVRWLYFYTGMSRSVRLLRASIRNVYQFRKNFGEKPCVPSKMNLLACMEEFLQRRYEFRKNELRDEVEYRERSSFCFSFRPVNEEVLNGICLNAMEEGIEAWDKDIRRYIYSPRVPHYHPVREYFSHLPVWDGKDRIRELAATVPTDNDKWGDYFYVWFLSMVAHWRKPDRMYANALVPILTGGQGTSKSVFFRRLLPPALQDYMVENINLENKNEVEMQMAQNLLIVIDEYDRVSKKYQADLKHLIQKPSLKVRKPHQKAFRSIPRLCAFAASANPSDILTDPTGSRRYICVRLKGAIDVSRSLQYDQLMAQAVAALHAGERYWLNSEEEAELNQRNTTFQQPPLEMQYLFEYFRMPKEGETGQKYSAVELLDYISARSHRKFSNTSSVLFSRMLKESGIEKVHTRQGNYYKLVEIK